MPEVITDGVYYSTFPAVHRSITILINTATSRHNTECLRDIPYTKLLNLRRETQRELKIFPLTWFIQSWDYNDKE